MSVDERFRRWDRNADGKLTADEVPGERLFRMLDRDSDGVVTRDEVSALAGRGASERQRWRGVGVSHSAPLPPAADFKPRAHGEEAKAAGLKTDVLEKTDIEMQRHVAARNVAGIVAIIGRSGTQFWIDQESKLFAVFMVQTQRYRSPAFNDFRQLTTTAIGEQ
jgi:hypothetical protein